MTEIPKLGHNLKIFRGNLILSPFWSKRHPPRAQEKVLEGLRSAGLNKVNSEIPLFLGFK